LLNFYQGFLTHLTGVDEMKNLDQYESVSDQKVAAKHCEQAELRMQNKQRGAANMQIVLGLIVMAILTVAALAGFKYVTQTKAANEIQELSELKTATVSLGVSTGTNFSSVVMSNLTQLNFFPAARVSGTGASTVVLNQWKGTITVAPTTLVSTADSLDFTYTGVPTDACSYIVEQIGNLADQVSIGGTIVKALGGTINLTTAYAQCNAGANNVTMDYVFSR
jgi:PilS N terminal